MRRTSFTLVELLVVIAVIAILAALLLPVFSAARAAARQTVCVSQLRQIGMACQMYRQDYGEFPPHLSWTETAYVRDPALFVCPNDRLHGQYPGNERLEGNTYLPSGVSYDYMPQWRIALNLGWWNPAPSFGDGKWGDLTPLAACQWHWATRFDPNLTRNMAGAKGWELILTAGGSVRRIRVEEPVELFSPDRYR
ncbi:MAG: type II secretion system protein [Chthonomonadales bacterium]